MRPRSLQDVKTLYGASAQNHKALRRGLQTFRIRRPNWSRCGVGHHHIAPISPVAYQKMLLLSVITLTYRNKIDLCGYRCKSPVDTKIADTDNTRLLCPREGYSSGQRGQTVNLPAYAFEGSNPSPSTICGETKVVRRQVIAGRRFEAWASSSSAGVVQW